MVEVPAGNTGRGWSWLRSGREHWAWVVVVEVRQRNTVDRGSQLSKDDEDDEEDEEEEDEAGGGGGGGGGAGAGGAGGAGGGGGN